MVGVAEALPFSSEVTTKEFLPKVEIDPKLQAVDIPYSVQFNTELYATLMKERGMKDEDIAKIKIKIRPGRGKLVAGSYNKLTRTIKINTGPAWSYYEKYLSLVDEATNVYFPKKLTKDAFEVLLTTKKLSHYFEIAPPERARQFAKKLLSDAFTRRVKETFAHESKHTLDFTNSVKNNVIDFVLKSLVFQTGYYFPQIVGRFIAENISHASVAITPETLPFVILSSAMAGLSAFLCYYSVDPYEKRARKFQKQIIIDPRWAQVLQIIPKENK